MYLLTERMSTSGKGQTTAKKGRSLVRDRSNACSLTRTSRHRGGFSSVGGPELPFGHVRSFHTVSGEVLTYAPLHYRL